MILHILATPWSVRRALSPRDLEDIKDLVSKSETRHAGQVVIAIEHALYPSAILRGCSPRERAVEVFSKLRVWDTEHNSGVLLYLLFADRSIEIVADRGVVAHVPQSQFDKICDALVEDLSRGDYKGGISKALETISTLLEKHFPKCADDGNELSDGVRIL